jgi:hypothetical protein
MPDQKKEGLSMKQLIYLLTILVMCAVWPCYAGEVYIWTNAEGIKQITDTPPPESVKGKVEKETSRRDAPHEIENWQRKNKAAVDGAYSKIQAQERIRQQNIESERARNSAAAQAVAAGNQRADKAESDAKKRLQFVRDQGFNLPQADIDRLEKAAAAKADQIRKGTDTPISEREDIEFHMQQKINDLENEVRRNKY